MNRISLCLGALACLAFLGGGVARADVCGSVSGNIVKNCGFESGSFSNWSVTGNLQGGVGGNYIGVDNSNPNSGNYEAYFGAESAAAQGTGTSLYGPVTTLSQTLAGQAGQIYQISFYLDNNGCSVTDNPGCGDYHNYFDAYFNGQQLTQVYDMAYSGNYVEYTFDVSTSFNPSLNNYVLQFDTTNDSDYFYLDDISVKSLGAATPEPSSLALLGTGLLGAVGVMRRRFSR